MTSGRVRTFLGVWAPIILGALVIVFAVNFLLRTSETPASWPKDLSWDAWRYACAGGLLFIAVILGISTWGRVRSSEARRRAWGRWYRRRNGERSEHPPSPRPPQWP